MGADSQDIVSAVFCCGRFPFLNVPRTPDTAMSFTDNENKEDVALLDEEETRQPGKWARRQTSNRQWCWWTTANLLLLVTFTIGNLTIWSRQRPAVWRTDLPDARKAIEYEEREYTGALTYDPDQRKIFRLRDAETEYFGPPSPEIERAWDELLHGMYQRKAHMQKSTC